jgi:hypothetical protein
MTKQKANQSAFFTCICFELVQSLIPSVVKGSKYCEMNEPGILEAELEGGLSTLSPH